MAKSSGMSDVLVLGAVGVGVYLAWPTIVGFLTGVTTSLNAAGLPASTPVPTPAPTPTPAPAPTCPVASFVCPDGTLLTQTGTGPNCTLGPWGTCPVSTTDPCSAVDPGELATLQAMAAAGTDPTFLGTAWKVNPTCLAKLASTAKAIQIGQQAMKTAGLGAVRRPLMTRAYRGNYRRRMA